MKFERFRPLMMADGGGAGGNEPGEPQGGQPSGGQAFEFDYEKLASIVTGKQSVAEDTVLKNYFKAQGLSKEEMETAISTFKAQKEKNTPDVGAIQSQLASAQQAMIDAQIQNQALLMSGELGVDLKTMPYLIKMADLSQVINDGKIDNEKVKESLTKVLDDIPALKNNAGDGAGFKFGKDGNKGGSPGNDDDALKRAFGIG